MAFGLWIFVFNFDYLLVDPLESSNAYGTGIGSIGVADAKFAAPAYGCKGFFV